MEKLLWIAIALLWMGMIGAAAFGVEPITESSRVIDLPGSTAARVDMAVGVSPFQSLLSVTQAINPVASVREISMTSNRQPVIEAGQHGGAELAGAFLIGSAALWSARRRRII